MKLKRTTIIEALKYLVFGTLAALVNIASYAVLSRLLKFSTTLATSIAWLLANLFSFAVNQVFVFKIKQSSLAKLFISCAIFLFSRLLSGFGDVFLMHYFVDIAKFPDIPVKIAITSFLGIINYLLGKFLIFKKN